MQTIYLDISNKGVVPVVYAKQRDVGRKFQVVLTDSGLPYAIPSGSVFSVWYSGKSGEGNYTGIGDHSAFVVSENKVLVEMITQMLSNSGDGILCLSLNESNGNQIGFWNIPYLCESVPGVDSNEAEAYYTAFSEAVANLPYPDTSLSVPGKAADAAATGTALAGKAPAGYGLGEVSPSGLIQTTAALDAAKATGWYRFYGYESGSYWNIGGYLSGLIEAKGSRTATDGIRQYFYPDGCNAYLVRMMAGGAWSKWEWVNPPMIAGQEYRTTERWNGKPVYAWMIDVGALPNTSTKTVYFSNSASTVDEVIYCGGSTNGGMSLPHVVANTTASVYLDNGRGYVNLITGVDRSASTAKILVKYTKTTD